MKCPTPSCAGRLECLSTREAAAPGRTVRYRACPVCGLRAPTVETLLAITVRPTAHCPLPPPLPTATADCD